MPFFNAMLAPSNDLSALQPSDRPMSMR
jgi:hypothetical protein